MLNGPEHTDKIMGLPDKEMLAALPPVALQWYHNHVVETGNRLSAGIAAGIAEAQEAMETILKTQEETDVRDYFALYSENMANSLVLFYYSALLVRLQEALNEKGIDYDAGNGDPSAN